MATVILAVLVPVAFAVGMLSTWLLMRRRREKDQNATAHDLRQEDIHMEANECYQQMKEVTQHNIGSSDSAYETVGN